MPVSSSIVNPIAQRIRDVFGDIHPCCRSARQPSSEAFAMNPPTDHRPSPWHAGEKAMHARVGVTGDIEAYGRRVIRDYMPDQHRDFYHQLPFMIVGAVDTQGRPWATLLEGPEGFVTSPDPRRLVLATERDPQDPAASGLDAGSAVGLLGIELHTRRRNRMNGILEHVAADRLQVAVEHAFGNCPQYIQKRLYTREQTVRGKQAARQDFTSLDEPLIEMIHKADTFFVASYIEHEDGRRSVDVSHRGGRPGFIHVTANRLTIPDYAGNLHFNTLGNLQLNPVAGLLFVDFDSGDVLQLSGTTALIFSSPMIDTFKGAERLWTLDVQHAVLRRRALSIRWKLQEMA